MTENTSIQDMLEAIAGEFIGSKNRITVWAPDRAGNTAIAWVNFDPRTRKWNLKFNDAAPQGLVDEFKNSAPTEHIRAMIKTAASGEYNGNDGQYDFVYSGGNLTSNIPD